VGRGDHLRRPYAPGAARCQLSIQLRGV
jgi:hypothetical protein